MLIGSESPFRKIPTVLNSRQALFLDGIRFAADAADLAYRRLVDTLWRVAQRDVADIDIVSATVDAWSVVDSLNRLRVVLKHMPGLKRKDTNVQLYYRTTEEVEKLRHYVQHLDEKISGLVPTESPVWGKLQWLAVLDRDKGLIRVCNIVTGSFVLGNHPAQNPIGKVFRADVDHVILAAGESSANISDSMRHLETLVQGFEKNLAEKFQGEPFRSSDIRLADILITFDTTPGDDAQAPVEADPQKGQTVEPRAVGKVESKSD